MSALLIDIGNSRLKWMTTDNAKSSTKIRASIEHGNIQQGEWETFRLWLQQHPSFDSLDYVLVASVRDAMPWKQALQLIFGQRLVWLETTPANSLVADTGVFNNPIQHCYPSPERLGIDRWLAMVGAITCHRRQNNVVFDKPIELIVVDAGTAMTVDLVRCASQDSGEYVCQHQGGWIVPGQQLAQQQLFQRTAKVNPYQDEVKSSSGELAESHAGSDSFVGDGSQVRFGTNTVACVELGCQAQQLGMLVLLQSQYPNAKILITGGDGAELFSGWLAHWQTMGEVDNSDAISSAVQHCPCLIFEGLNEISNQLGSSTR